MGLKAGRNDPCPCGSGRKYKRCCLPKDTVAEGDAVNRRRATDDLRVSLRRAEGEIIENLVAFAEKRFGTTALDQAWSDFLGKENLKADPNHAEFGQLFLPYFATQWRPRSGWWPRALSRTIADAYVKETGTGLPETARRFLETMCLAPISFHQVRAVEAGSSMVLRDVLLEDERTVLEQSASRTLRPGDVVFGRVLALEGPTIMSGCGSVVIPPEDLGTLMELRRGLKRRLKKVDSDVLLAAQDELRAIYFDLAEMLAKPPEMRLHNTDGDPIEFVTLTFDLKIPVREALASLQGLSLEPVDDILAGAEQDPDGTVRRAEFSWAREGNRKFKGWDNTILGHLRVEPGILVADVNSRKRAGRLTKEITKRLHGNAVLKSTARKSLEEAKREAPVGDGGRGRKESEELMRQPEVRAQITAMMQDQWKRWLDESIPALDGKTPRQAARTKEGRERLEALLFSFERREGGPGENLFAPDIARLRSELGIK